MKTGIVISGIEIEVSDITVGDVCTVDALTALVAEANKIADSQGFTGAEMLSGYGVERTAEYQEFCEQRATSWTINCGIDFDELAMILSRGIDGRVVMSRRITVAMQCARALAPNILCYAGGREDIVKAIETWKNPAGEAILSEKEINAATPNLDAITAKRRRVVNANESARADSFCGDNYSEKLVWRREVATRWIADSGIDFTDMINLLLSVGEKDNTRKNRDDAIDSISDLMCSSEKNGIHPKDLSKALRINDVRNH